jgi:Ca-activated chloride channel family protein
VSARRLPPIAGVLLALAGTALPGFGQEPGIWVHLTSPADGEAVVGRVRLVAEALAERPLRDLSFFVDGRPVGSLAAPPFELRVDLGGDNRSHLIEVVATDATGRQARHSVRTAPVPVGSEYEVELRQLFVTVTRGGEPVRGLGQGAFTVVDDGRPQQLITFAGGEVPFTAVLLIDASASMYGAKLEAARAGAASFISGMHELDEAKVVAFSDVVQNSTPFSSTPEVLSAGFTGVTGTGGTAVNDHLYAALKLLETRQGRRLVVLLSDGVDSHSALAAAAVREHARRSQAMVYWIRLLDPGESLDERDQPQMVSAWRSPSEYREQRGALQEIVERSGGRVLPVRSPAEIEPVFAAILRELRAQYALGYYPAERRRDGSWHRLRVEVDRSDVDVRTAQGYLDY